VLVLVLPVTLNLLVSTASPAPSRTELATRTRLITIDGLNRYSELLRTDYQFTDKPELLLPRDGKIDVGARVRGLYLVGRDVDERIQNLLDQFDVRLVGQQALVDRYGAFSPAIVMHEGMAALAGNGSKRYRSFHKQVDTFHRSWKDFFEPRILSGTAMTARDFDVMPRFAWGEEMDGGPQYEAFKRLLQILIPAVLLIGISAWSLRKYPAA
jgi:ABC-2 type transport system permease protein